MYAVESPTTQPQSGTGGVPKHQKPSSRQRGRTRRKSEARVAWLLAAPALLILAGMLAYPLYSMIVLSFQNMRLRERLTGIAPPWVGFDQYQRVLTDGEFWAVAGRTFAFTAVSVTISVIIGLGIALLMRRVAPWVRITMMIAMMLVWSLPQLVAAQSIKWLVDTDFGVVNYLLDKLPGVEFANHSWFVNPWQGWLVITTMVCWSGIPFLAITLNAGLTQVPKELLEAATVDGAGFWQSLRHITVPILKPLITIVTTLSVIWNTGLFTQNWVLRDSKPEPYFQTLATYSYTQAFGQSRYSLGSAIAVITVLMMLGVMVFYIRQMFKIGEVD